MNNVSKIYDYIGEHVVVATKHDNIYRGTLIDITDDHLVILDDHTKKDKGFHQSWDVALEDVIGWLVNGVTEAIHLQRKQSTKTK